MIENNFKFIDFISNFDVYKLCYIACNGSFSNAFLLKERIYEEN